MDNIQRLEQQADFLMQNISGWESSTLNRIGKRINKYSKLSLADVKSINNVAAVKQDMDAITKELAKVTGLNMSQVEQMYADLIEQQHLANQPLYDYRGKTFVPFAENRELQAIVRAYAKTTGETMINLAKTKALCIMSANGKPIGMQKYYTDVLDKAVMQVTTGATDFHTAMRDTIVELGGSGVRVDYGGGVTRRLDTVVRQNLLWGAKQASTEYNNMIGEELGCDGIEIDWHSNPRPSHEFMQGKQFVIGKARTINGVHFDSADEALERLQDYGCLHFKTPIICGVSEPRFSPEELKRLNEQNAKTYDIDGKTVTGYEATQMQRRLETAVRNEKTTRDLAKASGDNALVKRCNERIKAYQNKYNEISEITGIQGDKKRMSVPKSKNVLTNNADGGIIKNGKALSTSIGMANESKIKWDSKGAEISKEAYKELRDYAQSKGITLSGFRKSDVDVELAKEFVDDAEKILKDYPELNSNSKKPFTLQLNYFMDDDTFAEVPQGVNHIIKLNGNAMRNKARLVEEYAKLAEEGFFVKGTDYHSIISHEMGHILAQHKGADGAEALRNILGFEEKWSAIDWCDDNISKYAGLNPTGDEILSEAFSAYRANKANEIILKLLKDCGLI